MWLDKLYIFPLFITFLQFQDGGAGALQLARSADLYRHLETLDSNGKYVLEWNVNWEEERVYFKTTVATRGFILFGLSHKGNNGSLGDMIVGGMDAKGRPYFQDYHRTPGGEEPTLDQFQNWRFHAANNNKTHTWIYFSRLFNTCDKQGDIEISDDTLALHWAYGKAQWTSTTSDNFQAEDSGYFNAYLLDPKYAPPKKLTRTGIVDKQESHSQLGDNTSLWSIRRTIKLPPKKTTYWCTLHKLSLPRKHHIIGVGIRSNQDGRHWDLHHLLVHQCKFPPNVNPDEVFEPFLNYRGEECHRPAVHNGIMPYRYCKETVYGTAIGERRTFIPDHVGLPIGESSTEYYLVQVHYENEHEEPGIMADMELQLFYTSNLRKYDGGMFTAGAETPGSPSVLVPPNSPSHRVYGHCSSGCTQHILPPSGIKMYAGLLHAHKSGRQMRVLHFRGDKELPWILNDDNYNSRYQAVRLLHEERTFLPGDQISVGCTYDSSQRNWTTVGGFPADHEMCSTFILYYPNIEGFALCRSEIRSEEYMTRYLGITNVTWDPSQLEYVALAPLSRSGLTISEVSDKYVNWDAKLRRQLQKDHIFYPQKATCPKFNSEGGLELPSKPLDSVAYPESAAKYNPPPGRC